MNPGIPFPERIKQCQVDAWTIREHLCLASAVTRNGDQNWAAVSRSIRFLTSELDRPLNWYSTKNCALQYDKLLEQVDIPKRKREKGEANLIETPGETLTKMLSERYIEELVGIMEEERATYENLRREVQLLESDQCNNRLHQFWDELVREQEKEEEEKAKARNLYKDREEKIKILQSTSKLQSCKGIGSSTLLKNFPEKDLEKLPASLGEQSCFFENSSEVDSGENMETGSLVTTTNVSFSSVSSSISASHCKSMEVPRFLESQPCTMKSNIGNCSTKDNEHYNVTEGNISTSLKTDKSCTATIDVVYEEHSVSPTEAKLIQETAIDQNSIPNYIRDRNVEKNSIIDKLQDSEDNLKATKDNIDYSEKVVQAENEILLTCKNELNKDEIKEVASANKTDQEFKEDINLKMFDNLTIVSQSKNYEKLESSPIALDVMEDRLNSSMKIEKENSRIRTLENELIGENITDDTSLDSQVENEIELQLELKKAKNDFKYVAASSHQYMGLEKEKFTEYHGEFNRDLGEKRDNNESMLMRGEENAMNADDVSIRRGRKRKLNVTSVKEENKNKSLEVKLKIKLEGLPDEEPKSLDFEENDKKERCDASSSDELLIEKLTHADERKKDDLDEKKKSVKKEVKDEYEFDDDISRDSTDVREFYLNRADRRKFSLADGICSPLISESAPSSPASISYGDDMDTEKHHRSWKRSIMLIWSDIAAHKNASLFLRPITEDKVPGYHSIVYRPIDLLTIKRNVENGLTKTTSDFQHDIMLMFLNAKMYNTKDHNIFRMADEMMRDVLIFIEELVNTQLVTNTKILETPQKNLRRETRESSAKRGDDRKKDDKDEKTVKRRKLS